MTRAITSLDVARRAGVSQSAVSRVFSGASASAATAEKVRRAADELGYRPNQLARAMITGQSRIIGLVVAYMDNQFYPAALQQLSEALQAKGYHILIFTVGNAPEDVKRVFEELTSFWVDGIVTASVALSSALTARCAAAGIPIVLFNRGQDLSGLSSVTSANVDGGRLVAQFLIGGGHERIAHIAGWEGSSTGQDRQRGFLEGLAAAGREAHGVLPGNYDREEAAAAARTLFSARDRPDAVFVANDHMAFAVMDVLRFEFGLRVPEDVSVVGYDDVPLAAWPAYALTTLRQPLSRMVTATVETLLGQIEDRDRAPEKIEIAGPLILRRSARIPRGWTP